MASIRTVWQRYLVWRRAEDETPTPVPDLSTIKKVDASDEDLIREATANRAAGWGSPG